MRILVAIAYYGTTNAAYVRRLIDEYASMSFDVDVVVLSEADKDLDDVEMRIGLPIPNPYSLPFAHKPLFVERLQSYDLFIYSEDDTLITERSIDSFLWATEILPPTAIAGFLRTEENVDGSLRCSSVNSHFHWRPDSGFEAGDECFAEYTNPHGAAYMLTRAQLEAAIESGGFLLPAREGRFDMRVTAATDPYTSCGFDKAICLSRLDDFLLPHLSNRYVTTDLGISLEEFRAQAAVMQRIVTGDVAADRLLNPTTRLDDARWDQNFWSPVDDAAVSAVAAGEPGSVLSFGVGAGATEAVLVDSGIGVTGIPLDNVIAVSARQNGIITTPPDLRAALDTQDGQRFDALLAVGCLHHLPDPASVLRELRVSLRAEAVVVATLPNPRREWMRWMTRRTTVKPPRDDFDTTGVHLVGGGEAASWFRAAGYEDVTVAYTPDRRRAATAFAPLLSPELQVRARVPALWAARNPSEGRRPRVSVGLPVFNGENYLEHALRSILDQDMADLEVIVCDNASTDATEEICRAAAEGDTRVRYVRHERNLGAARNYNECFRRSSGEFFTWLAHDDMRSTRFLSGCLDAFDIDGGQSAVLVYPRADFIDEQGVPRAHDDYGVETRAHSPAARVGVAVSDTGAVNPIFGLIRSSALEQTRLIGPFIASDRVLLVELAMLGEIHEVPETLSFRRLHSEMSTNVNPDKVQRTAWFDPDARASRLNEIPLLAFEYSRSALQIPLTRRQRVACLVAVPTRMLRRHGRIVLGRWRRQILARLGSIRS